MMFTDSEVAVTRDTVSMAKDAMVMAISVCCDALVMAEPTMACCCSTSITPIEVLLRLHWKYMKVLNMMFTDSEVAVTRDTVSMAKRCNGYGYISVLRCTGYGGAYYGNCCSTSITPIEVLLRLHWKYMKVLNMMFTDSEVAVTRDTVSMAKDAMLMAISVCCDALVMAEPTMACCCSTSFTPIEVLLRLHWKYMKVLNMMFTDSEVAVTMDTVSMAKDAMVMAISVCCDALVMAELTMDFANSLPVYICCNLFTQWYPFLNLTSYYTSFMDI
ncbi:hypothetical protein CDAR_126761 [Caerostris darwini]|uniref:Uncharacterized protein n=1 Tax=Caerostris darwini TaxID=1538125 RepID=A0AAV4RC85_9ARAC|nr:hypothetical protein CDAR_126761 [Caerostris darwini]